MTTDASGLLGTRVREYDILELVGRGGMGAVYRAKHHLLQEERAIKVVARRPAEDQEFTERFIREARVLARLKDEHLVRLYEFWEDQGQLFMALEFLRGESVAERLKKRTRLSLVDAVSIARQAALGLKVAHEGHVVHRDISPDNLQIVHRPGGGEIVKVMDFGIAKALEEVHRELTANLFLGKFEYASPEQCGFGLERGETIDWRSDIYSLGVTLFKMTTGLLPFSAGTPQGYLVKHATAAPPLPSRMAPEARLPAELDRVVLRALAKNRAERPQSMAEFIKELAAIPLEPTEAPAATEVIASPPAATPSPSPATADSRTGRTSGLRMDTSFARKYVIKGRLGEGGMGVVYRAVDTILNEPVALKVISERFVGGPDSLERLKREVVLARRVAHPNVCRIYDIGESDDGIHYVSMEYIEGKPLGRVLREKTVLALREAIPVARQVLDALTAAHAANVVHRDLKPDNIMVTPQGHAVIMDFGLSLSEDSQRVTRAGFVIGTPHYMAPEQVTGVNVDLRCDLYALGVILFRMVTGRLPFPSKDTLEVLKAQMETPPPKPSEIHPQVPPLLESIILKALEKDPARRFSSAESFLNALDPVEPAQIRTSTESGRVTRVPRTGRQRLAEPPPAEASPTAPTAARAPSGLAPRLTDPERVKAFLSGDATVRGSETPATEERSVGSMTVTEGEQRSPGPSVKPPPPRTRREPAPGPPAPTPPAPSKLGPLLGGGAALVLAGAGAGYYLLSRPDPVPPTTIASATSVPSPPPPSVAVTQPTAPPSTSTATTPPPIRPSPRATATAAPTTRPTPAPLLPTTLPPVPTTLAPATLAPAPPTTAPAPPATQAPRPALPPEQGVRQALREYAEAFSRLDRRAVASIFPGVPDRNFEELERNFKEYSMQIEVQRLVVQPERERVVVECRIQHTYTTFSGKRDTRSAKENMIFIEKNGRWVRIQ